jgi:hypothetical protein
MEAANKNYVDNQILTHAADDAIHITASQNTLLDGITVTYAEINTLAGLSGNIQTSLDSKLDLAGGTMTGAITLAGPPTANLHAVTKQYVDDADATKLSLAGGTMTGDIVLSGDPTLNLHPATKQYVDTSVSTHGTDDSLHLTSAQNAWIDAITATSAEVNNLVGTTSSVQTQLDSKLALAGGNMTGDIVFDATHNVYVSKVPVNPTELVNKTYVDSLFTGRDWKDSVTDINLVDDSLSTPPLTPAVGDVYIIGNSATGDWLGKDGYATYWDGTAWVFLQNRAVAVGDRFGVALISTTVPTGGLAGTAGTIVTITDATVGAIQYSTDVLTAGTSVLVFDPDSSKFGVTYTYTDEGNWVPTNTSVNLSAGDALSLNGNTLNVLYSNGLTLSGNSLTLALEPNTALAFSGTNNLEILLDGTTLTQSSTGLKITDSIITDINDKVSKTQSNTVTGSIVIDAAGTLQTNATISVAADVVNKGYVDAADANLQTQVDSLNTTVTTLNTDPVTKTYVDTQDATKVNKAGDTMTGALVLSGDPTLGLHSATKQYVDNNLSSHATDASLHLTSAQNTWIDAITASSTEVNYLAGVTSAIQTQLDGKLNLTGGTLTGVLALAADPTTNLEAATKQYVDNNDALKVNKAGDTLTGFLTLHSDPTAALHPATKQYADALNTSLTTYVDTQDATKVNKAGDTMTGALVLSGDPVNNLEAATKQYVDGEITTLTTYVDTADTNLQSQIDSINTTVNTLNTDPVTKTYVDTQDSTKLALAGGTMTGYITLHADPAQALHPATKQYVDSVAQGLASRPSVRLATTGNLAAVYDNGTLGVNATLTASTNGALTVDGLAANTGDRILVRAQTNAAENGDYVVQQTGDATTPFILKRVETVDESSEIPSSYFFVEDGNTLEGTGWVFVVDNPITFTIGTDPITVNQFSGQGSIIAGNGLTLTGNTLDINTASTSRIVVNADNIDLATTGVSPGTFTKVTVDGYGRVTSASSPTTLTGYGIIDGQPLNANLTSLSGVSTTGLLVMDSTNTVTTKAIAVSGVGLTITNGSGANSGNITIASNATDASTAGAVVARDASGNFSANTITAALSGNATTATTLETARDISVAGDATSPVVSFNGSANVSLNVTLTDTGVTAGTYTQVSVDSKGRVVSATSPTTIAGYGITDAASITYVDTKVAELEAKLNDLYLYLQTRA